MADLTTTIETAAAKPQSASSDGVSATSRSLSDLIAVDKYLASKTATQGDPTDMFRRARIVPPGAV